MGPLNYREQSISTIKANFIIRNIIDRMIKAFDTELFDRLTGKIEYLNRYLSEKKGEYDTSQCISSYVASELKMFRSK